MFTIILCFRFFFRIIFILYHVHLKRISNLQHIHKFSLPQIMDGLKLSLLKDHILMIIKLKHGFSKGYTCLWYHKT
uniref:Secreted protein n=1 Tax=Strongyloides venezuelensis TaxID=75913 RepID=A0A0K0ETZ7_STRVS